MPGSTPCVAIPYPLDSDPINVAVDMQNMAARIDALICAIGGNPIGSFTPWFDNGGPVPPGYLRCVGGTFDPLAYPDLAAHLGSNNVPDLRERFLRGTGGNFPGNAQTSGWADAVVAPHTHTVADHQHGMAHTHTLSAHQHYMDHTHSLSGHTHGGSTSTNGQHGHNIGHGVQLWWVDPNGWQLPPGWPAPGGGGSPMGGAQWLHDGNHAHSFGTGGPSYDATGSTRQWTDPPNVDGTGPSRALTDYAGAQTTAGLAGTAVAGTHLNRNLPPFYNITWLIRATADVV